MSDALAQAIDRLQRAVKVEPRPRTGSAHLGVTDWANALDRVQTLAQDALDGLESIDSEHVVEFTEDNFAIQHPMRCRPDLLACDVHAALTALDGPPVDPGRYTVTLSGDGLAYEQAMV